MTSSVDTDLDELRGSNTGQAREPDWEEDGVVGWLLFKGYDVERDGTGTGAPTFRIGDDRLDEARVRQVRDTLTAALGEPSGGTVQAPDVAAPSHADLVRAIADPGSFLPRGDNYRESIPSWSARAVRALLGTGTTPTTEETT